MTAPNPPPGEHGWQLRLLRTWGRDDEARALLDSLNAFNTAFDGKPFTMPEPITGPMEGLDICPASKPRHLGGGRWEIAA